MCAQWHFQYSKFDKYFKNTFGINVMLNVWFFISFTSIKSKRASTQTMSRSTVGGRGPSEMQRQQMSWSWSLSENTVEIWSGELAKIVFVSNNKIPCIHIHDIGRGYSPLAMDIHDIGRGGRYFYSNSRAITRNQLVRELGHYLVGHKPVLGYIFVPNIIKFHESISISHAECAKTMHN